MTQQSHCWAHALKEPQFKGHMYPMFTAALFTLARTWKQPRCLSRDKWIKKM